MPDRIIAGAIGFILGMGTSVALTHWIMQGIGPRF